MVFSLLIGENYGGHTLLPNKNYVLQDYLDHWCIYGSMQKQPRFQPRTIDFTTPSSCVVRFRFSTDFLGREPNLNSLV